MKLQRAPMLPQISARGRGNVSARGGPESARSRSSDPKFNKLKGVLVNNLLKYYHKQVGRQGDQQVYARAVEEVERILQHGKLQEKHLRELQQRFATGIGIEPRPPSDSKLGGTQALAEHTTGRVHESMGEIGAEDRSNADAMSNANGSPSKRPVLPLACENGTNLSARKVDEWSVMTLYNDVRHYEEQKQLKDKQLQDKAKTREELLEQMNMKQRLQEDRKAAERKAAQEQQKRYEAWQQEKETLDQRKLQKMAEERSRAAQVRSINEQQKKAEAEAKLREEQRTLQVFRDQMEEEKQKKLRDVEIKQKQYEAVMAENEKELERKRMLKEKGKEDDARLFKLQLEMAEKQERQRAAREEARQLKLKAAERMAEVQGNNAAEIDKQVEERVRRAQEDLRQRELERERSKREKQKKATQDMMGVLQQQVALLEDKRDKAKAAERARALELQKEAEAYQREQHMQRIAKKERQLANKQQLDQQRALKDLQKEHHSGMSEVELRMNASILKQVVSDQPDLPEEIAAKLNI